MNTKFPISILTVGKRVQRELQPDGMKCVLSSMRKKRNHFFPPFQKVGDLEPKYLNYTKDLYLYSSSTIISCVNIKTWLYLKFIKNYVVTNCVTNSYSMQGTILQNKLNEQLRHFLHFSYLMLRLFSNNQN